MKEQCLQYFVTKLSHDTDIYNCYFCMPSNDCFTFCINELQSALKNQLEENIKNNYVLELSRWFYAFLEKDKILKNVDSLRFSHLLLLLKDLAEGKQSNKEETITLLTNFKSVLSNEYFTNVSSEIVKVVADICPNYDYLDYLTELFLNECLARDIDIRFIHKTIEWFKKGVFKSIEDYLSFFTAKKRIAYDIYLPIINYKSENEDVFKLNEQEITCVDGVYYLHIFKNGFIDYFNIITSHMVRVDSIFNMLKLYTSTEIDYDRNKDILVDISCPSLADLKEEYISFNQITKYKGISPYTKFMIGTITNLNELYEKDKLLYHKLLNIIGYSEKDNDYISSSSYVDAWISLESLYSLNKISSGYNSVKQLLPSFVSPRIIINKLTFILKNAFKGKTKVTSEDFIKMDDEKLNVYLQKTKNFFYKRELQKFKARISSVKELYKYYVSIESRIRIDIIRIYMLRNEYVHESKLSAFKSLQFYKLKNYLTISIDLFFNMLNQCLEYSTRKEQDIAYKVFYKIKEKNTLRETFFKISTEKRKYNNSEILAINEIGNSIDLSDVITNIILNNNSITTKYIKFDS